MRRILIGAASLVLALTLGTSSASAQFFVGGYATLPQSDFKDDAKTGWMAAVGYKAFASEDGRYGLWVEGDYGSNKADDDSGKTNIMMGLVTPVYNLTAEGSAIPYLLGSVGYLNHQWKPDTGDSENSGTLVFGGGLGVGFGDFWIDGRYMTASKDGYSTAFIMIGAGVTF
jgi:hypothetical protein